MNNTTTPLIRGGGEESSTTESVVFILLGLFIVFGNAVSVLVFWRRRFFLKRSTVLLINLTVADLLVGLVIIGSQVENVLPQDMSSGVEDILMTAIIPLDAFSGLSSIFFLAAIAIEKAHAVLRPIPHVTLTTRCYVILVCTVWILTGFLSCLVLLSWCDYLNQELSAIVISSFLGLALFTMCISYTTIWIKFRKRYFVPQSPETLVNRKLVKTLFLVTALSLISWLPFHILFIIFHIFPHIPLSDATIVLTRFLQYANSFVNPIIYNLRMPEFRKTMLQLICGCVVKDRPKIRIQLTSIKRH